MSDEKKQGVGEKVIFKTPSKMAFIMGILVGVTLTSLTAFVMTYSLLRSDLSGTESTSGQVAGVDVGADTNPTPSPAQPTQPTQPTPTKADIQVKSDDHIRGDKNAPVTMIEYSDFECPFCSRVQPTIEKILSDYEGQVNLVYRHFPLSFHPNAQKAGEASECAAEQGKFWEMHDMMFADQDQLDVDSLKNSAKELGLDTSSFDKCLDDGKYAQKVKDDIAEGSNYGVQGTPATFVNGQLVSGAQPYENFASVIDGLLD